MDMQRGFRIGPWAVSPLTGEIESAGKTVHLEPKVMEVLVALAAKAESVVLREELLEKVWGARAAVSDEPLTRCIAQLRQAFGDSSRSPQFIQTVPKRGYRLMVPAEAIDEAPVPAARAAGGDAGADAAARAANPNAWLGSWQLVATIAALVVLGLIAYRALPLIYSTGDYASVDPCNIEQVTDFLPRIDAEARALCEEGVALMAFRDESSLQRAMSRFREAIEIDDEYGSAYVQLARAMVLLPTYAEFVLPGDCWYDEHEEDPIDCYEGAIRLIERNRLKAPYIDPYVNGIEGYVATKQRRWFEAAGWFRLAQTETPRDADMWQWLSQFHASVGDMERALEAIEEANGLDSESGVNRERKGVLLMWQHPDANNLEAESWFDRASELDHNHYEAAWLVLNIRLGNWNEVTRSLQNHARATNDDAPWIDIFVAALMETSDEAGVDAAITAIEPAIDARQLHGQYEYGAWVFLEQPARAIDAALDLIDARPEDMDVEFLFSPETRFMRQHDRFGEIVEKLGLRRYWNEDPDNCPPLFLQQGERNWCEQA